MSATTEMNTKTNANLMVALEDVDFFLSTMLSNMDYITPATGKAQVSITWLRQTLATIHTARDKANEANEKEAA